MTDPSAPQHLADVAALLAASPTSREATVRAAQHIRNRKGKPLFDALYRRENPMQGAESDPTAALMSLFESVATVDAGVALYLMGRLYPTARKKRHHEICEAIELWAHAAPPEAAELLSILCEEVGPGAKEMFTNWVSRIRQKKPAADES